MAKMDGLNERRDGDCNKVSCYRKFDLLPKVYLPRFFPRLNIAVEVKRIAILSKTRNFTTSHVGSNPLILICVTSTSQFSLGFSVELLVMRIAHLDFKLVCFMQSQYDITLWTPMFDVLATRTH